MTGVLGDRGLTAPGLDDPGDPLSVKQRHRHDQVILAGSAFGGAQTDRAAHHGLSASRSMARNEQAGRRVQGQRPREPGQIDPVTRRQRKIDIASGGDGVALQAHKLLVAEAALHDQRERDPEQDDRARRHARDGEHEPPSHESSKR